MRKINRAKGTLLTPSQFTFTLKAIMTGIATMSLPNLVIKVSKQDGWISIILGAVYPIYLVIVANFMSKKFPKDNILVLSKKCFGNILGSILNFIFISFFLFILTAEFSGYSNVFRVYAVTFLKNYQVLLTVLIPISFVSYKGIKTLGRLNEIGFYLTICLIIFPVGILAYGSLLNLMPIFGSGLSNIVKGSSKTVFAFCGMEIIFLIYPFLQEQKNY
nr:spore germination protein [Clostridium algoriphilum]